MFIVIWKQPVTCEKLLDQAMKMARLEGRCSDYCLYLDGKDDDAGATVCMCLYTQVTW